METIVAAALAALAAIVGSIVSFRVASKAEETRRHAEETAGKIAAVEVQTHGWQALQAAQLADLARMRAERDEALARADELERDLTEERKIVEAFARRLEGGADES